jgi:hypothetical protein
MDICTGGGNDALVLCITAAAQDDAARKKLRAQSNEFRKEVIRVSDGVYVAVGYSGRSTPPRETITCRPPSIC